MAYLSRETESAAFVSSNQFHLWNIRKPASRSRKLARTRCLHSSSVADQILCLAAKIRLCERIDVNTLHDPVDAGLVQKYLFVLLYCPGSRQDLSERIAIYAELCRCCFEEICRHIKQWRLPLRKSWLAASSIPDHPLADPRYQVLLQAPQGYLLWRSSFRE